MSCAKAVVRDNYCSASRDGTDERPISCRSDEAGSDNDLSQSAALRQNQRRPTTVRETSSSWMITR